MSVVGKSAKVIELSNAFDNSAAHTYVTLVGKVIQEQIDSEKTHLKLRFDDGNELWFIPKELEIQGN